MYKIYIVILLTVLNFSVFSQIGNRRSGNTGISNVINYPVPDRIGGLKLNVHLTIEHGITKRKF